ncbi:hypothetical protein POUND7_004990 [Theobroma cacao]
MGGCASRPKEFDTPVDAPASPEKAQLETTAQENTDGGEDQNKQPLVDLSEPEKEAQNSSSDSNAATAAELVSADTAKPTEDDVKAVANNAEDKVEATQADKSKAAPSKEEDKNDAPLVTL